MLSAAMSSACNSLGSRLVPSREKERKKDIMSLLVRARKESLESEPTGWSMGDDAMMDQVVSILEGWRERVC